MELQFEWKINVVALTSLIIAITALIISSNVAFGGSNLKVEYSAGGKADMYFYYNNTLVYEFVVINDGFGATVYSVEPAACSIIETCLPEDAEIKVEIKYNDDKEFKQIYNAELKSIEAKSAHLVQVAISNISEENMPQNIEVFVRDARNNKHIWTKFRKSPLDLEFYLKTLE